MVVWAVIASLFWGCGDGASGSAEEANRITGEICTLQLERMREISPDQTGGQKVLFTDFQRADDGTVYLLDGRNVRLYIFDNSGNLKREILAPGDGPGEFPPHPKLQILNRHLWILGIRKVGKFTLDGQLLEEFKMMNFYRCMRMVNDRQFVATLEALTPKNSSHNTFNKLVGLVELRSERLKKTYIEVPDVGKLVMALPEKRSISVALGTKILHDLLFAVDADAGTVFYSHSAGYTIFKQQLDQNSAEKISYQYNPPPFSPEDKRNIAQSIRGIPDSAKKQIEDMLPDFLPAIHEIRVLDSGHLLVRRVTGIQSTVCDILESNGNFHCSFRIDPQLKPRQLKMYGATVAVIEETDDGNLYREYNIENYEQIFSN
jgi:hypothetical protein